MDFSFNADQKMIAEAAETFLASVSSSERVRAVMQTPSGFEDDLWQQICAEMGWQLTHIPEQFEGLGLGYVELSILHEHMGRNLLCAPFFSSVSLGATALMVAGTGSQKHKGLRQIAEQGTRYAFAYSANTRAAGCDAVQASYHVDGDGVVLNGDYHYVVDGHTAEHLIVVARQEGTADKQGLALFVIPAEQEGVSAEHTPSMDQTRKLARVQLKQVALSANAIMANPGDAADAFETILALSHVCLAAEQLGVAEKSLSLTLEYINQRVQFGRVVGGFQAMKHKAADMMTKLEAARSAVYYAACIADEYLQDGPLGGELIEAASIAKAYCCDAAFFNAGMAIQMHGGVGFTWEYDVHLYFKRAKAAQLSFGDSAWHKEQIAKIALGETS